MSLRLAVFTNQFPSLVSTFFARDMRALLEAGIDIDIFPLYPLDQDLWRYVPEILSPEVLPRSRVHHVDIRQSFRFDGRSPRGNFRRFVGDVLAVGASAARFGAGPVAKSTYAAVKAWLWAREAREEGRAYDHVLAYWGNYAATSAYHFHRLTNPEVPFSMFLHAGADLYRQRVYLRQKLLYADNIIVVCEFSKDYIQQLYRSRTRPAASKIQVYHPGLDLADYAYVPDGRLPARVIAVGRFDRRKGFDYLIRAVDVLRRRGRELELELVGDGEEGANLRGLVEQLGIADRVQFRGWRNSEEVRLALAKATILAHPSTGLGDAVPTVIKESMAVGTPVVASSVAGIPELLDGGRCGVLVPPKDVDALANALETLLAEDEVRVRYSVAARRFAEQTFDLWRNGNCLADLLCSSKRLAS